MSFKIAQVVVGLPVEGPFDYFIPEEIRDELAVGSRVIVPFGPRRLVGYVVKRLSRSRLKKIKSVLTLLDSRPALDAEMLALTRDFAALYGCSWGEAIETGLPVSLRRKKSFDIAAVSHPPRDQRPGGVIYYQDPGRRDYWSFLLERMRRTLAAGGSVLLLTPDKVSGVGLETRLKKELAEPLVRLDRQLTAKKELENWLAVRSGRCRVVLGTRSAVFAPLPRPGLIVVFDEDNAAYKQDQTPFYHVRDVVWLRTRRPGVGVLFISSAPSVALWHRIRSKTVEKHARQSAPLAPLRMIDLSNYKLRKRGSISFVLQNHIRDVLQRQGRVVLFLNRRGFSTMIRCAKCGHTVQCPRCDVNLTYIYSKKKLLCPLCQTSFDLPAECPGCGAPSLRYIGAGIEKIESEAARLFPRARVERYDRESAAFPREADIVIATQAVLRVAGTLTTDMIAVLDIDAELSRMDFRSSQQVFSLLVQLRAMAREAVFVQTLWHDHVCFGAAANLDYKKFYAAEARLRRECRLPPFVHLVSFGLRGEEKQKVFDRARAVYAKLNEMKANGLEILEPQPDIIPKLRDKYRFTIMIKGRSVKTMIAAIKSASKGIRSKGGIIETININP